MLSYMHNNYEWEWAAYYEEILSLIYTMCLSLSHQNLTITHTFILQGWERVLLFFIQTADPILDH